MPDKERTTLSCSQPQCLCYASTRVAVTMIPAKTECLSTWTLEYSGYLTSDTNNWNGDLFFHVEASYNEMLCPLYDPQKPITLSLCVMMSHIEICWHIDRIQYHCLCTTMNIIRTFIHMLTISFIIIMNVCMVSFFRGGYLNSSSKTFTMCYDVTYWHMDRTTCNGVW